MDEGGVAALPVAERPRLVDLDLPKMPHFLDLAFGGSSSRKGCEAGSRVTADAVIALATGCGRQLGTAGLGWWDGLPSAMPIVTIPVSPTSSSESGVVVRTTVDVGGERGRESGLESGEGALPLIGM